MKNYDMGLSILSKLLTTPAGWAGLAMFASAGEVSVTLQLQKTQVELTAHGITGDRVTLDISSGLKTWSTHSGVVLGPGARAKTQDMPGWRIPISPDGVVTFVDSVPKPTEAKFFRIRTPGPGWEEARQRWTSLKVREYRYRFRRSCFCFGPPGEGIVHVKDGKVIDVEELNSPQVPPGPVAGDPALYPTIDGLFDLLDQFVKSGADVIQFSIDPSLGIPLRISVDQLLGAVDDEVAYTAGEFQRIE